LERAQLLALIREGLGTLARDEAELVRRHYFEGERIDDIGRSLGITRPWAGRILARAVARLTRHVRRKL
jgi:DNA-directed RNA polymerase specialized sigma24 family protein